MTPNVIAQDPTVSFNPMRTGWDPAQPQLAPSQVSAADFGQLFSTAVDGQVYTQPLVIGSTVVVATENNKVYGIHAVTGAILWSKSLGPAWPAAAIGCGDLVPNIGVTSTPVFDPSSGRVYLTAKVNVDGDPHGKSVQWFLHSLDVATGNEPPNWPVKIQGSPPNNAGVVFDPFTAQQRTGLLLLDGEVFAGFGAHCDADTYFGYLVGVKTATGALRMWCAQNTGGKTPRSGVWMGGGGLVSDGPGRIFFSTGNGISPAPGPGNQPPGHLAESVIHVSSNGQLTAVDFFSPGNADQLDLHDQDFGSGGPVALPSPPFGTPAHPKLLVQIGKDGRVFLLDRDDLGGRGQGPGGSDGALSVAGPFRGVWGHLAVWGGDGGFVYVPENDGHLRALKYGVDGTGTPVLANAGTSSAEIGHYPGSPIVTSDGMTSGSALVWVVCPDPKGKDGSNAQLRAYDAVPVNGVLTLRWSAPIGTAVKFAKVGVGSGRVYVGTRDGRLIAFGSPSQAALTGTPVDFGQVAVGAAGNATTTVTAARGVTVTAITTAAPFSATPPALPVTLNTGGTLAVPVGFAPTGPGGATGTLSFAVTTNGVAGTVGLDLHGTGTQPGFAASPPSLDFGQLATQSSMTLSVIVTNTGTTPETIGGTTSSSPPFTVAGLPPVGFSLAPGTSLAVSATYAPTVPSPAGGDSSQFTVTGSDGLSVTVPLTGTAVVGAPQLTIKPTSVDFGQVPVGGSLSRTFDIKNTGNVTLNVTKAAPPTAPFSAPDPIAEGQQLGPDQQVTQTVVFTPTAAGPASGHFLLTGDDSQGMQTVSFTGTGVTSGSVAPPSADGWTFNGTAVLSGTDIVLTEAINDQTGSALCDMAVPSANLRAHFTAVIGGGGASGADGLAFVLLDAAHETPHALGGGGGGLGYSGLHGLAVTLDTSKNANDPSANFVALATGGQGDALVYAATATNIGDLRTGTHTVDVQVTGGRVQVTVDGRAAIDTTVAVPAGVLVGFTGATGGLNDNHRVQGVSITF
ncbi:choice-of-anchor D domain-containing protein [Kitasatospora sp. NPDC048407]|uniref:choice-of-anchor D domain-containing protein n=1 Tax=Kitasatospora sp. NPDC048407 TaxID=3364051 RepID=UPI0037212261